MRKIVITLILLLVYELYANRESLSEFKNNEFENTSQTIYLEYKDIHSTNYDTSSTIPTYSFGEYLVE